MNELLLRRLVGALVLLLAAFGLASLVPGTAPSTVDAGLAGANGPRQVVRYDLQTGAPMGLKLEGSLKQSPSAAAPPAPPAAEPTLPPNLKPESQPSPGPGADPKVEAKPEPKAEPKVDTRSEPRPPAKPAVPVSGAPGWSVQVGSFSDPGNAQGAREQLGKAGLSSSVQEVRIGRALWYRVRVGPYNSEAEAVRTLKKVQNLDYRGARVLQD